MKNTTGSPPRTKHRRWRSFPKVSNLFQYVPSGEYYARIKMDGKSIRHGLETDVFSTAKLKLVDFLKDQHKTRAGVQSVTFAEALKLYENELEHDTMLKPQSKQYRRWCILKIKTSWPELLEVNLEKISIEACREWATKLRSEIASHYYNNTLATLRLIIAAGIKEFIRLGGQALANPAEELSRARVKQKELKLPEPGQFRALVDNLAKRSGGWGRRISEMVQFLAYSGMRAFSEAQWVTWEDVDWQRKEIIVRGNPDTGTKNSEIRRVPVLLNMEALLHQIKDSCDSRESTGKILEVRRCDEALARACKEIGIPRITHHDLRHLFATRCIESGVDIPTVSRWLGHKDGGALAMKVYGHLRNEHSQQMAQKVRF